MDRISELERLILQEENCILNLTDPFYKGTIKRALDKIIKLSLEKEYWLSKKMVSKNTDI